MTKYGKDIEEIKIQLATMNQHLKDKIPELEKTIAHNHDHIIDHEKRIGLLEKWQFKAIGISAGAMAILGLIIHFIG